MHLEQVVERARSACTASSSDVGRGQALARTLNLIVAPASSRAAKVGRRRLSRRSAAHSPSRTLVLRRHGSDRLDAEVVLECELPDAAGRVGVCPRPGDADRR